MENAGPGSRGTGSRGTESRGVENTGSGGNHGVSVQNTVEPLFRPTIKSKFCYVKLQWKSIGLKRVFGHKSELNISWERKPLKCQLDMQWSLRGVSVLYFAVTCVDLLFILKNCEMLTIVLLSIFNREKRPPATVAVFARLNAGYLKHVMAAN